MMEKCLYLINQWKFSITWNFLAAFSIETQERLKNYFFVLEIKYSLFLCDIYQKYVHYYASFSLYIT